MYRVILILAFATMAFAATEEHRARPPPMTGYEGTGATMGNILNNVVRPPQPSVSGSDHQNSGPSSGTSSAKPQRPSSMTPPNAEDFASIFDAVIGKRKVGEKFDSDDVLSCICCILLSILYTICHLIYQLTCCMCDIMGYLITEADLSRMLFQK